MRALKTAVLMLLLLVAFNANAQTDKETLQKLIGSKTFTLIATRRVDNNANPDPYRDKLSTNGEAKYTMDLTSWTAFLTITPSFISSNLNEFRIPDLNYKYLDGSKSSRFSYKALKNKKGDWNINIDLPEFNAKGYLNISKNGFATLTINSLKHNVITYTGYITSNEKVLASK